MTYRAMNLCLALTLVALMVASTAVAQQGKLTSLVGTWQRKHEENPQLKIYNDTHFNWAVYDAASGKFLSGGGGTYTFDGKTLKEKIIYSTYPELNGTEQTFNVESSDPDSFHQTGTVAANGDTIDETFTRVRADKAADGEM
jgi:hypothetical protein